MRNLLAAITLVACVFFASSAMSAGVKAPKEMCLEIADGSALTFFCLALKSIGSVKFANNQKLHYYSIAGSFSYVGTHFPVGGTGYIENSIFRFHLTGQFTGDPTHQSIDGYVNLASEPATGSANAILTSPGELASQTPYLLFKVPCSGVSAPDGL